MNKLEWREWYRDQRVEARAEAVKMFEAWPGVETVCVPSYLPITSSQWRVHMMSIEVKR